MSRNNIIAELLDEVRTGCREEEKRLKDNYSSYLINIKYSPWKELNNLKHVLTEVGDIISEMDCSYELLIFDDEKEFPNGDLNYQANQLIGFLSANNITIANQFDFDNITSIEWFKLLVKSEAHKSFWHKLQFRFNEIKKRHPEEYNKYVKKQEQTNTTYQKLKWNADLSDLGYIFRNISDLGYFEFPKNNRGNDDLKSLAEILLNTFDVQGSLSSLKEFLSERGQKNDRMKTKYKNTLEITSDSELFKIPPSYKHN